MDDTHLPDEGPPQPSPGTARHPMLATTGILGVVLAVCLLLALVSML